MHVAKPLETEEARHIYTNGSGAPQRSRIYHKRRGYLTLLEDIWHFKGHRRTNKVFAVLKKQVFPPMWTSECPQNPFGILCYEGSMLLVGLWPAQSLLCWNNAAVVLPNLITPSRGRKATAPNLIVRSSDLGPSVRKGLIHFPSRLPPHSHKPFLFFTMTWFCLSDANYALIYPDMCPIIYFVAIVSVLLSL